MDVDGSNSKLLTDNLSGNESAGWSPDGQHVLITSERDGAEEIYLMDPDGKNVKLLTGVDDQNLFPAWSPDSKQIAFVSDRDGNFEIYIMNANRTPRLLVTSNSSAQI